MHPASSHLLSLSREREVITDVLPHNMEISPRITCQNLGLYNTTRLFLVTGTCDGSKRKCQKGTEASRQCLRCLNDVLHQPALSVLWPPQPPYTSTVCLLSPIPSQVISLDPDFLVLVNREFSLTVMTFSLVAGVPSRKTIMKS